jgi:replicative DNA helicase
MDNLRNLPCNVQAENIIIATIMQHSNQLKRVQGILTPNMFYAGLNGEIFRACLILQSEQKPISTLSIYDFFRERDLTERFGGWDGMLQISRLEAPSVNVDIFAQMVAKNYEQRELIRFCQESADRFYDEDLANNKQLFEQGLIELRKNTGRNTAKNMGKAIAEAYSVLDETYIKRVSGDKPEIDNLPTGLTDLDALLDGGIPKQRLVYILGSSGMGKTTLGLQIAKYCAVDMNLPVMFFSLEMSTESQAFKVISANCDIPLGAMASANFEPDKFEAILHTQEQFAKRKLFVDDQTRQINDICLKARQFYSQHGQIGMVLIDYLTLIKTTDSTYGNRHQQIENICQELNQLKKDLNTRIVVLAQIGRAVKERADKRPLITDAKESGAIEETADLMLGCYRDEYYNPNSQDRGIFEVIVLKNRYGKLGTVKALWDGKYSRIKNLGGRS